jgi:hypothetical protein
MTCGELAGLALPNTQITSATAVPAGHSRTCRSATPTRSVANRLEWFGTGRQMWLRHLGNRWFADSPLEESRFELAVPPRTE